MNSEQELKKAIQKAYKEGMKMKKKKKKSFMEEKIKAKKILSKSKQLVVRIPEIKQEPYKSIYFKEKSIKLGGELTK